MDTFQASAFLALVTWMFILLGVERMIHTNYPGIPWREERHKANTRLIQGALALAIVDVVLIAFTLPDGMVFLGVNGGFAVAIAFLLITEFRDRVGARELLPHQAVLALTEQCNCLQSRKAMLRPKNFKFAGANKVSLEREICVVMDCPKYRVGVVGSSWVYDMLWSAFHRFRNVIIVPNGFDLRLRQHYLVEVVDTARNGYMVVGNDPDPYYC